LCDAHGDGAGSGKITLEARENLTEGSKPAGEQTMRVSILGSAGPRSGGYRQAVAFEDLDPLEVFCQSAGHRQPADSRSNDYRTLTQETTHELHSY
jgi:hypothetical protein